MDMMRGVRGNEWRSELLGKTPARGLLAPGTGEPHVTQGARAHAWAATGPVVHRQPSQENSLLSHDLAAVYW